MLRKETFCFSKHWRTTLFSMLMSLCMTTAFAQSGTIKGKIIDELGDPILGANVIEKGTTNGATTDLDGNYTITVGNAQKSILQFSFIGYTTKEEAVNGRKEIQVKLDPSVVNLGEVVAIGYGTQTRREITGSVANVSEESFNKGVTRDATDLLQGKVAGLTITSGSGDVTRGSTMRLRGTSTLQNDQGPLIVIDGIPGGDMSTVSPSDIESISVLKDASSAAIYGSRAAGGVVLITTKRGSGSKTLINYDGYIAMDKIANKPDLMNADQWREYAKYSGQDTKDYDKYGADTDWFDELTRTGISQNHSISMSGGGSKNNYRASYTYLDRKGIMRDNDLKRHNIRFQVQQRAINDRLRLGLTGSATMGDANQSNGHNYIRAYNMLPVYPVYNPDGSYFTALNPEFDLGNPVQNQDLNTKTNSRNFIYGSGDIQFTVTEGLNLKASFYKSRFADEFTEYRDSRTTLGQDQNGYAEKRNDIKGRELMEWTGDYEKAFGNNQDHKIQAVAGYSWEENSSTYFFGRNRKFLTNELGANNLQSGTGLKQGDVESGKNTFKLISLFARAHYSYQERYMLTATVRRDGSSKFGANHKWGTFPSASVAWGLSQESFMKDVKWIDDLKVRAGYGVTGNQDGLDPYKSLKLYGSSGTYFENGSWLAAYKISQNENPNLKWESTAMLNIGLDFSLFNGRLGGTIEWYNKKTSDMLYTYKVPTPPYVYEKMQANVGDMSNKGIELLLNYSAIRQKDFGWNISLNLSHNKNKVTRLSNDLYTTSRVYTGDPWIRGASGQKSHVLEEGYPVGQFYMLKCNGISEDGKFIIEDINDDGVISDDDRTYVGSAQPDLTFGLNNSFNYKSWDLSFFIRGTIGNKVLNNPRAAYGNNTYLIGSNALNDPLIYELKGQNSMVCSYYLEDGSFARLDNLSLGYTFNTKSINWLDKARVYVAAQNLFVITKYKGLDPEVELFRGKATDEDAGLSPGIEPRDFFPKSRTFTLGVNLTF